MSEIAAILDLLQAIQQKVSEAKESLGRLQVEWDDLSAAAAKSDVIPPTAPGREIVGGQETDEFPDCCAVGHDYGYTCSGTLIAPNVVVTADHCRNISRVFLRGNDVDKPDKGDTIHVARQYAHPEVDLRVLVLDENASVPPRQVAGEAEIANAVTNGEGLKMATLVGFGTIDQNGLLGYGRKRRVDVAIATIDCSLAGDAKAHGCMPGREMVAGQRGLLKDTCCGDSGGPLYIQNGVGGGYFLLGATSRGSRNSTTACGDGGIYVRVDLCLDWIREVTGVDI